MEQPLRYTLGKADRLKSRKAIEQLFQTGKTCSVFPFRILYQFTPVPGEGATGSGKLQAGFTVSSRHFKKAVDRNRIKRLTREAYRLQKNDLAILPSLKANNLALFIIYIGKEIPAYELVYEKIALVIKRLIKIAGENN